MDPPNNVIKLSDAFPPDSTQNSVYLANVHKTLQEINTLTFEMKNLTVRAVKSRKELEELQLLHKEWFPINYSGEYFESIAKGKTKGLVAELKVVKSNRVSEKVVVGCIFYDVRPAKRKYMAIPFRELFKEYKNIYIMTIGVVNEFRKCGVASALLQEAVRGTLEKEKDLLKYVYLHVVEYNVSAQKFYEKNQFLKMKVKRKHYFIEGKYYDAWVYILYMNGAKRPLSCREILGIFCAKINVFGKFYQCVKWLVSFVYRGGSYKSLEAV